MNGNVTAKSMSGWIGDASDGGRRSLTGVNYGAFDEKMRISLTDEVPTTAPAQYEIVKILYKHPLKVFALLLHLSLHRFKLFLRHGNLIPSLPLLIRLILLY